MGSKRLLFLVPEHPDHGDRSEVTERETKDIVATLGATELTLTPFCLRCSENAVSATSLNVWNAFKESGADGILLTPRHLILVEQAIIVQETPVFLLGSGPEEPDEGKRRTRRIFLEVQEFSIPRPSKHFSLGTTYQVTNFRNGRASFTDMELKMFQSKLREAGHLSTRLSMNQLGGAPKSSEEWARRCKGVNALLMNHGQVIDAYRGLILPRNRGQHVFEVGGKYYEFKISSVFLPRAT